METSIIMKDRRKYQRFSVKEGVFASIDFPVEKLGQIFDISLGGLSFTYLNTNTSVDELTNSSITLSSAEKLLIEIPFQQVGDSETTNSPSLSILEIRKLRIQFGALSDAQISNLYEFIEKNSSIDDFAGHYEE